MTVVPISLLRSFAHEAISNAVAPTLYQEELTKKDKPMMQRKISKHGLGLKSVKTKTCFYSLQFSGSIKSIKLTF